MLKNVPPPPKPRNPVSAKAVPTPRIIPTPRQIPVKQGDTVMATLSANTITDAVTKELNRPLTRRVVEGDNTKKLSPMEAAENDVQVVKKSVDKLKFPAIKEKDIPQVAAAYVALKEMQNKAGEDIAQLRVPLEDYLKERKKVSATGSEYTDVEHLGHKFRITRELRESVEPKSDALIKINRSKKLKALRSKLVYTAEVLDLEELTKLVQRGKITEQEAKELVSVKKNYAFKVKSIGKK